jgi:hypothetical protein
LPVENKEKLRMKVMVIVPGDEKSEAFEIPDPKVFEDMNRYNEQLVKAGVMLAAEGLLPTSKGARIRFEGSKRTVMDGPFTEAKELIGGFWLLQVKDMDEAIEWVKRAPFDGGTELQIRQVGEADDYGDALPEHVRESEKRMRAQAETQPR